ncbi:MAG: tetratricopeptide repeat protein [Desulfobacterales bacterium]|nr:MAG: tetratricopeptide repeat protein [Desulfobacterales bacterium]
MLKPALQKIYVILGKQDEGQLEKLYRTLLALCSHVSLTSNLYLVAGNLPESMPHVEGILKGVSRFLRESLFARLYVHLVHPVSQGSMKEIRLCYHYLKRATSAFDQEGYIHQELPRLMLLPIIIPNEQDELASLKSLLKELKESFLLPSLYLDSATFFLRQNEGVQAKAEKIYYGHGDSGNLADIVCSLHHQDIVDDSCAMLGSDSILMTNPCPASLIVSAQDGKVYACLNAFRNNWSLGDIFGEINGDGIMARYDAHDPYKGDCLVCRERVAECFADMPLPEETAHEIGALLYHFGALNQEAEDYVQAVKNYTQSLKLSPVEEVESIFFRLGFSYTKTGDYDKALEAFDKAEPAYQEKYYFHFFRGLCYFEQGDYHRALERFSEALRLKPQQEDLVRILIYIGTCHNCLGNYEKARLQLERAKEATGPVKEIYNALGFSYFQLKDYDRAIQNLSRAVEIDPDSAIDYASLGASYREKGDTDRAMAMYEKALALDPSIPSARENLERLKDKRN